MTDVKNIITLGIGASPGNIQYFVLVGLDVSISVVCEIEALTRTYLFSALSRVLSFDAKDRTFTFTAIEREY